MGKLIATEYVTLDGVMEAPGEETSLGPRGGWSFLFSGDEHNKVKSEELFASDALLLGRVTYQIFAAAWPSRTSEFADRINSLPKYVVSTTLDKVEWNNSHLIRENVAEEIKRLRQQPGKNILLCGSADLFHTLRQQNLIDEYRFMVYPIVLGAGKRLFKDGSTATMKLVETQTFRTGVVVLIYEPDRKA